jgi:glycerol-3-phosphate dehydrogenase
MGGAMWMYDLTGGLRIKKRHERISADQAIAHMPTLRRASVASAYIYYDCRADDARLTLAIARTAASLGAAIANDARVTGLVKGADGSVRGAHVEADGSRFDVRARAVVNATGVWSDDVRTMDEGTHPGSIRPAKGIHLTVPWSKVRNEIAVIVPVPKDRRSVFVIPWGDTTYVGTTDTDYDGPLDDPQCTTADIAYLLGALNHAIDEPVGPADVVGTWAGLRPLLRTASSKRTADLSRRHGVRVSPTGLITINGGKLTTYRRMAADTIDAAAARLGRRSRSRTKHLALIGGERFDDQGEPGVAAEPSLHEHLAGRYGTEASALIDLIEAEPELGATLVPGLPYVKAEAVHAVRHEMARSVDDVLSRRTRARLLARDASAAAAGAVGALLAPELGWDEDETHRQVDAYVAAVTRERRAADLPETALDASLGT